jgi:hypothetical protein
MSTQGLLDEHLRMNCCIQLIDPHDPRPCKMSLQHSYLLITVSSFGDDYVSDFVLHLAFSCRWGD